ncbi:hypothetical protein MMC20_005161 [Loxospora ochrophaea]|nr:hypothetical protein [Loxospora ochrophaea]
MDLSLHLSKTHVLITGAGGYIGSTTVHAFLSAGAYVTACDINESKLSALPSHPNLVRVHGDITSESSLENTFSVAQLHFKTPVQCCIALASLDLSVLPHHVSLIDMPVEQWRETYRVNVEGTFLTARRWLKGIRDAKASGIKMGNVGLIIVGSESGLFGERGNADYASGKSAVQGGLVASLKGDVVRVWKGAR